MTYEMNMENKEICKSYLESFEEKISNTVRSEFLKPKDVKEIFDSIFEEDK